MRLPGLAQLWLWSCPSWLLVLSRGTYEALAVASHHHHVWILWLLLRYYLLTCCSSLRGPQVFSQRRRLLLPESWGTCYTSMTLGWQHSNPLMVNPWRGLNLLVINDLHLLGLGWTSIIVCPVRWGSLKTLSDQGVLSGLSQVIINRCCSTCVWRWSCRWCHHHQGSLRRHIQHHLGSLNISLKESSSSNRRHKSVTCCVFSAIGRSGGKLHRVSWVGTINSWLKSG